uniref:U39-Liphistoxin-Lsp1a_1 n=1 Tax=Liphistius sp. SGP-2016 TaxID=1905180 RepID=A0A4Q8K4I6_9ARAC
MKTIVLVFAVVVLVGLYETSDAAHICDDSKQEVFTSCGTACPDTCENYNEIRACTDQCVQGCFCRRGQVRRSDGHCVEPVDC